MQFLREQKGLARGAIVGIIAVGILGVLIYSLTFTRTEEVLPEEGEVSEMMDAGEKMEDAEMTMDAPEKQAEVLKEDTGTDLGNDIMEAVEMQASFSGKILAGNKTPIVDFHKADYERELNSDKLIVLYFYADWCPICKSEVSTALYPAFNSLDNENVVGFRVNYNDNFTDSDERNLAREFGVAYQHTKVFLKNGERILKSPESWNKGRYLSEIDSYSN